MNLVSSSMGMSGGVKWGRVVGVCQHLAIRAQSDKGLFCAKYIVDMCHAHACAECESTRFTYTRE